MFEQVLGIVNRGNDLNGDNIVEKIKEQIKKIDSSTYEEWEKKKFDINYEFSNNNDYNKKELILLHLACLYNQPQLRIRSQ
ncbi:hypothetical protein [Wolbachia pipientis]|uniref:hypothetical protein n=1 Tax=Wolbachia pipientis TaxID=955 RepID=UPI001C946532|nr:hypothetical protein [Wolbachia pipientis]